MTKQTVLATLALAGALAVVPAPAHAEDQQPCVAPREFNSVHFQTKGSLERRWEVAGQGVRVSIPGYGTAVTYPRCGYSRAEAWYGVFYQRRGAHLWTYGVVWWKA